MNPLLPEHQANRREVPRQECETLVEQAFVIEDPALRRLVNDIVQVCALQHVLPPWPPLQHRFITPGGIYRGQWIWDTMFVTDALRLLPGQTGLLREVFQNYWDFQERWSAIRPEWAQGMIACCMRPEQDWTTCDSQFTMVPLVAWGVRRAYEATGDLELVRTAIPGLVRYHDWYWRERDLMGNGLVTVGTYLTLEHLVAGQPAEQHSLLRLIQDARWETGVDVEVCLDWLDVTPHPQDPTRLGKAWYGTVCTPGATAFLIHAERELAVLAELAGDPVLAKQRRAKAEAAAQAMRTHMWDEEAGTFLAVRRDNLEKCPRTRRRWWEGPPSLATRFSPTIGSWLPLVAGVPTPAQAARMAQTLAAPEWYSPAGICTVGRSDPAFGPDRFWRGDTWANTTYLIVRGLADYGFHDLAAEIADRTVENALRHGLPERYHTDTGEPLGLRDYAFGCAVLSLLADGITKKYRIEVRPHPQGERRTP